MRCTSATCCAGSKNSNARSASWSAAVAEYRVEQLEGRVGELLVRQDTGRDLRDLTRYADDPVAFTVEVLHGQPWALQRELMTAVRDCPLVACAGANACGKDWALAALGLWWVYAK